VHRTIKDHCKKQPNLTYGEVLAVLEKEYSLLNAGAKAGASLEDALKRRTSRRRARV
jgi:hypothetical protein